MRLIPPTLLLFLVDIHITISSSIYPYTSIISPSGETCPLLQNLDAERAKQVMKCLRDKCGWRFNRCKGHVQCWSFFWCYWRFCPNPWNDTKCIKNCASQNQDGAELTKCAFAKDCIPRTDFLCPGAMDVGREVDLNLPKLVEQMTRKVWKGVLTADPYQNGHYNFPCSKWRISGTGDKVCVSFSACYGDSYSGKCSIGYDSFYGEGKQRGNSGIIDLTLTKEGSPVGTTKITMYVHRFVEDTFAVVSFCTKAGNYTILSKNMILSPFETYESLRENIDNATDTKLVKAVSKFIGDKLYKMNNANCTN